MSLSGPIVVVADENSAVRDALAQGGNLPCRLAAPAQAAKMIAAAKPSAVILADTTPDPEHAVAQECADAVDACDGSIIPILAIKQDDAASYPLALPVAAADVATRLVPRLRAALRVRALHATVLRRIETLADAADIPDTVDYDPIEDATVIVTGRGRGYPALSTAVGERVGLIGALSVETAAKYLNARDVDGIVIGDAFNPRTVEAFLTVLGEDARFRDLPIAVVPEIPPAVDQSLLPNLEHVGGEPAEIVERILPLVRQHAFEARLQRQLGALETKGLIDPQTGLFTIAAFLRELNRAVDEAKVRGNALTLARFTFPPTLDRRANMDAARLVSRLVRSADFACRADDGSILLAFAETALRSAHVVARRIANVLRHTMLQADGDDGKPMRVDPTITLASLKGADTVESLLARVSEPVAVAAQ